MLWKLLCRLLADTSVKAGVESFHPPFALETLYHVLSRLRLRIPELPPELHREHDDGNGPSDRLLETMRDFQSAFGQEKSPLAQFQLQFQRPLMG